MSFEKIKTYIQEARDFYSTNLTDTPLENIEERMCLLITQDVNHHFKVGSWLAKMFYDDVLHPKSRYFVKVKVFVNSEKYKEFINMPRCLLSSSYSHYTLKECYPSSRDCMECWKYWCSFCTEGSNSVYGACDSIDCLYYMKNYLSKLTEDMNDDNKMGIILTVRSLRMTEDEVREYKLEKFNARDYGLEEKYEFAGEELVIDA